MTTVLVTPLVLFTVRGNDSAISTKLRRINGEQEAQKLGSHLRDSIGHCFGFFKKQRVSGNDYGVKDTFKSTERDILISVCRKLPI